ncbi:extracellular protein [Lactiplantibacillus fabifermentans DSM 21115]|uniref:Extracellular protein n=1 Tax=Lactiplantibacillus fabifermentans DSM 21115 TaxID=1413187 RepID=A0A0R2NLL1_9LACO|nr:extracellular protein [Lactiplantibacillus fabifermentans DSM 21115]
MNLKSGLASGVAVAALALFPLAVAAAGPGTATSNLTNVTDGYAADSTSTAEAQTTAQFVVAPGSLTLNSVPNIALSNTNVKDIATAATTLPLSSSSTVTGATTYDGDGNGTLTVNDYRGSHAGWTLTVGMGPFSSGSSTVSSATLNLVTSKPTTDNASTSAPVALNIPQSTVTSGWITNPQTLWAAAANTGEGQNTASTTEASSLAVAKQPLISAGTYSATLYWALQNAPTAAPASTTTP